MTDRRMAIDPGEKPVVAQLCDGRARRTGARRGGAGVRTVDTSASPGTGSPSRLVLRPSAGERRSGPARPGGEPQQIFSGRRPELDFPAFYLAEIADLVAHRGAPKLPERLVDAICRRAGDRRFIRELVRHLLDDRALPRDRLTRLSELGVLARLRHAAQPASRARLRVVHEDDADELAHPPARISERCEALDVAEFRLEGDFWSITYEAQTVRLRDARGMRYLGLLLAQPGRELHVNDIVSRAVGGGDGRVRGVPRDAGPVSDARARSEYGKRLTELRDELEHAEQANDLGRVAHLREEIEALANQLVAAARNRKSSSHAERARLTVTKGLKRALERIAASHTELGRHLAATIRRGYFCVYRPDTRRPICWRT